MKKMLFTDEQLSSLPWDSFRSIAIGGHVRPDGDCVGAALGLRSYLLQNLSRCRLDVILEPVQEKFSFLPGADTVRSDLSELERSKELKTDLFIAVDCATEKRLSLPSRSAFFQAQKTVSIDHHETNPGYADFNFIKGMAPAVCEYLSDLIPEEQMTEDTAACLYTGIVTDTEFFRTESVTDHTMKTAERLRARIENPGALADRVYFQNTFAQQRILGHALLNARYFEKEKLIASCLTQSDMKNFGVTVQDIDQIINQLRVTRDCRLAVFVYEVVPGEFKVSMRSMDQINVAEIAERHGGGGHARSAGFSIPLSHDNPWDAIEKLLPEFD